MLPETFFLFCSLPTSCDLVALLTVGHRTIMLIFEHSSLTRMRYGKKSAKKFSSSATKQLLLLSKQSWQNFPCDSFSKELLQLHLWNLRTMRQLRTNSCPRFVSENLTLRILNFYIELLQFLMKC